jgi:hypothetical protein
MAAIAATISRGNEWKRGKRLHSRSVHAVTDARIVLTIRKRTTHHTSCDIHNIVVQAPTVGESSEVTYQCTEPLNGQRGRGQNAQVDT